ncbi:DUF4386 domain-containing protein [Kribbella antibiotica]|uniref:DUF4386 domain-containing protein n=1 Tax=Kribbella antibiotica TaxID=190195 RepID=A0A4R4ZJB1_9ACTN|nr:DUF4386 domain-containing protein [Kribbella antibiotica]TDD58565.1 DUF4386 domain-containing protein [Kribbella antibiotica]
MIRRITGSLFVLAAVAFGVAASVLSATFDWPDILREPADVVLPAFSAGGSCLIWTWFAVAWTYALLAIPILLLPQALGRRDDPLLRVATWIGAASVLLSLIGFLRWVFVVPALARAYAEGDPAVEAAWLAQHQYGGALLGEHLGQLLAIMWGIGISIALFREYRRLAIAGLIANVLYLTNQGNILATAFPNFPVWDLGGLLGSTAWGLWTIALGVTVARTGTSRSTGIHRADSGDSLELRRSEWSGPRPSAE